MILRGYKIFYSNQKINRMSDTNRITELIQTQGVQAIIESPIVADRFQTLYKTIHGAKDGETFYETEKFHFLKILSENKKLAGCTKMSLYGCFMDVAVNGLSFDPKFKHLYLIPRAANVGTKTNAVWEDRATLEISGYGELVLRKQQGQIKYADNPVLVWDGDLFEYGTSKGVSFVDHTAKLPRKSNLIIGCYIKIIRADGSQDYKVLSTDEVMNFKSFSKDPNSIAWTAGLPGMIQLKTIKHGFKSYPKVRVGKFSALESETIDEAAQLVNTEIKQAAVDYGIVSETQIQKEREFEQHNNLSSDIDDM